ncbi:hypothetical protein GFC01_15415 [Desulfofundulus thermobenzoicus]|uniref:Uncharacterized protein n=1 Tax=Desulfofundulus thermobenzoicus TaxID=29376 RepID=A0A6N7IU24_9FIRM|nr:hypothetical protein [Desulfofundulus thermobenzoicus]MQL53626.1 hypothetical protein [Desulfofundulus thermobenzoicus]
MPRMTHAQYPGESLPVSALYVDQHYNEFNTRLFTCYSCGVKVQFSRGKGHMDPHFKNWPNQPHDANCEIPNLCDNVSSTSGRGDIELLVSTILPRAMLNHEKHGKPDYNKNIQAKHFTSPRSRKFIYTIYDLLDHDNRYNLRPDYENIPIKVEDGSTVILKEIFGTQDQAIERINTYGPGPFILRASTFKPYFPSGHCVFLLTKSGKYGNSSDFRLFIHKNYLDKNIECIDSISNALFICYAYIEKSKYGYQAELFSIKHQLVILRKFTKN